MKINLLALLLAVLISIGLLVFALTTPSAFNFLPFAIHQAIFRDVIMEKSFIVIFDILTALFLVWFFYKILTRFVLLFSVKSE